MLVPSQLVWLPKGNTTFKTCTSVGKGKVDMRENLKGRTGKHLGVREDDKNKLFPGIL